MNHLIQQVERLLHALAASPKGDREQAVTLWERFRRDVEENAPKTTEIVDAIDWMIMHREWRLGEPLLVMAGTNSDPDLASKVCTIIELEDPAAPNENAIEFLAEARHTEAVPTLIRAVSFRFTFDPTLQIPVKALQALREIGNQEALDYLQHLSISEQGLLAEEASDLLGKK